MFWSMIITLLLIWSAIYLPYRLSFIDKISLNYYLMEIIIDFIFGVDIIINFFTAYYNEKNILEISRWKIAKRYVKSWFIIDLLSMSVYFSNIYSVPFELFTEAGEYSKGFRLLRLPRLYKLLKVIRLFKILKQSQIYHKIVFKMRLNHGIFIYSFIRGCKINQIICYYVLPLSFLYLSLVFLCEIK